MTGFSRFTRLAIGAQAFSAQAIFHTVYPDFRIADFCFLHIPE
jgi:hypothetical protein